MPEPAAKPDKHFRHPRPDPPEPKPAWNVPEPPKEARDAVEAMVDAEEQAAIEREGIQRRDPKFTARAAYWVPRYLAALRRFGSVGWAEKIAGVTGSTVYERKKTYPEFAQQCDEALWTAVRGLEDEIYRQAMNGQPLLAMFILKRWIPEYRDNFRPPEEDGKIKVEIPAELANDVLRLIMAHQGTKMVDVDVDRKALPGPAAEVKAAEVPCPA